MERYTQKFRALGNNTRLRIVYLLLKAKSDLCVCEITDSLEIAQYNISRHLTILKNAGLIQEHKEGRWVYFRLVREETELNEAIYHTVTQIPESLLERDLAELRKRLSIRADGKCERGIQKAHLKSS